VGGEVHDRINIVVSQGALYQRQVGYIAFDEAGAGVNRTPVSLDQVVENHNTMACIEQ
jgi:hypothetical protein